MWPPLKVAALFESAASSESCATAMNYRESTNAISREDGR
jgi:hypothetical protein